MVWNEEKEERVKDNLPILWELKWDKFQAESWDSNGWVPVTLVRMVALAW